MKTSSIFYCALLATALICGCKSPTAVVSSAPYVTITPSNLRQAEFVVDTFQARIFNHDFAETYFTWNMGDDTTIITAYYNFNSFESIYSYLKPGRYIVTVKAYDIYSNTVIASTTTPVIIDTSRSSVEIIAQFYHGIQTMNSHGLDPFSLSVKTSLPDNELYQFWDYGDGTTGSYLSGTSTHVFPQTGSYLLKVDVYQRNGIYVGTDTAAITINWPSFNLADFKQQSGKVESYLVIDNTYSFFFAAQNFLPLAIGEPFVGANIISTWDGNTFNVQYNYSDQNGAENEMLTGSISDDGMTINSFAISANFSASNGFGFQASNLKLFAVTQNSLIYKISGDSLRNNLQNANFVGNDGSYGQPDSWSSFITDKTVPQCILVLTKK